MYHDLKKLFYRNSEEAASVYKARFNDTSTTVVGLRENDPFFYWQPPELFKGILAIERLDRSVTELAAGLPTTAVNHYIAECMIDEIILTNDIEGVISTRKQVEAALEALKKHDKRTRFQGIANKYNALYNEETIPVATCEDIRSLYNDLVLDEVISDDPSKAPDGMLFRTDTVRVVDVADRVIHENNYSEKRIQQELSKQLAFFNDPETEPLVRAAVFHFAFAYIHPFYDGNGRTNRFMTSYLLTKEVSRFAGLRLSFSAKENSKDYYRAFTLAEDALNRGDITPFILTFLDIVAHALAKTHEALTEKKVSLERYRRELSEQFASDSLDIDRVGAALLEGALFTSNGLTAERIAEETHLSIPTVHKRLKDFEAFGLLNRTRSGRRVCYSLDVSALTGGVS